MPRILTNRTNLPEPMVRALENDQYIKRGYISTTSLISSAKERLLKRAMEYSVDVQDLLWAQFGTANHHLLEMASEQIDIYNKQNDLATRYVSELRMEKKVGGKLLTGTADLPMIVEPLILYDWKVSSVWKVADCVPYKCSVTGRMIYQATSKLWSWRGQGNIYKNMMEDANAVRFRVNPDYEKDLFDFVKKNKYHEDSDIRFLLSEYKKSFEIPILDDEIITFYDPIEVRHIRIILIMKDWSKKKSTFTKNYPKSPVAEIDVPIVDTDSMNKYIEKRVSFHLSQDTVYKEQGEQALVPCSARERWEKPVIWKFIPRGKSRSLKNFAIKNDSDREEATAWWVEQLKKDPTVQKFEYPSESPKCMEYCPVNIYCSQYKNMHS